MNNLLLVQVLNGLQYGVLLFLLAAGLTLVFGIMSFVNLAHGSLYMMGAYAAAVAANLTGSFVVSVFVAVLVTGVLGMVLELAVVWRLYRRDHLDHSATRRRTRRRTSRMDRIAGPRDVRRTSREAGKPHLPIAQLTHHRSRAKADLIKPVLTIHHHSVLRT